MFSAFTTSARRIYVIGHSAYTSGCNTLHISCLKLKAEAELKRRGVTERDIRRAMRVALRGGFATMRQTYRPGINYRFKEARFPEGVGGVIELKVYPRPKRESASRTTHQPALF